MKLPENIQHSIALTNVTLLIKVNVATFSVRRELNRLSVRLFERARRIRSFFWGIEYMNIHVAANAAVNDEGATPLTPTREISAAESRNDNIPQMEDATLIERPGRAIVAQAPDASVFKRMFDAVGAAALIIFFSPLMVATYIAVRLDGGPGMYVHERVGKNGVRFQCYKFRSMVPNADRVLRDILICSEDKRREWEADHKLRNDPRITPIGRFLRAKSLDELPQLFNVLKGDMSLVGPRPITSEEVSRYGRHIAYYYKSRPGLTGAWQVSGRSHVSYEERISLDVNYVRKWSFLADLQILLKTVRVVLTGHGAH